MIKLALDLATTKTGIAKLTEEGVVAYEINKKPVELLEHILGIITPYQPNEVMVYIEEIFIGPNKKTAMALAKLSGYIAFTLDMYGYKFQMVYPITYRKLLKSVGVTKKLEYQQYWQKELGCTVTDNISDALTMLLFMENLNPNTTHIVVE